MEWLQKARLGLRGWLRRRREHAERERAAFVDRELRWERPTATAPAAAAAPRPPGPQAEVDWDGLQVAWLDRSGRIGWYFDAATGEVIRSEEGAAPAGATLHRIPHRSVETDRADREAFLERVEDARLRSRLEEAIRADDPDAAFRAALASAREVERSWISFRNDRASSAVTEWVRKLESRRPIDPGSAR